MNWTLHISVALLNIVWIVFFLQPDPFSASKEQNVHRRSSDSLQEFCIHASQMTQNNEPELRNLTPYGGSNATDVNHIQQHRRFYTTITPTTHPTITQPSRRTAPGSETQIKGISSHQCLHPGNCTVISNGGRSRYDCCFKYLPGRVRKDLIRSYYMTDGPCHMPGTILVTKKCRHICVDPSQPWVVSIMKHLDKSPC